VFGARIGVRMTSAPSDRNTSSNRRRCPRKRGNSRVLVEAAASGPHDPTLRSFFGRIARRRGIKIARVAVARRLLTLCYYALRDENGCRAFPVAV
jgi:hypothetical protein